MSSSYEEAAKEHQEHLDYFKSPNPILTFVERAAHDNWTILYNLRPHDSSALWLINLPELKASLGIDYDCDPINKEMLSNLYFASGSGMIRGLSPAYEYEHETEDKLHKYTGYVGSQNVHFEEKLTSSEEGAHFMVRGFHLPHNEVRLHLAALERRSGGAVD